MTSIPPPISGSDDVEISAPAQPSLGLKVWVGLATVFNLIVVFSVAKMNYPGGGEGEEIGRAIGRVIGGVLFWPGLFAIIFSLSKKHRSPRRTCRVWLIATLIIGCLNLVALAGAMRRAENVKNSEIFASMRASTLENSEEMLGTDDLDRAVELQREGLQNLENSISNLAGEQQRGAAAALAAMRPMLQASERYTATVGRFGEQFGELLQTAESAADFDALLETLDETNAQHEGLIALIANLEDDAKRTLMESGLSPEAQRDYFTGIKAGFDPQRPYLNVVRGTEAEMLVQYREWIALLSSRFYEWELDEEGVFVWSTDEGLAAHNQIIEKLGELEAEQYEAQQRLIEVVRSKQ